MKYFVVSDIHGYYGYLIDALNEAGFSQDNINHKLIICGDLFDRGHEACKLQEYILSLISNDKVILIRGNHEDLYLQMCASLPELCADNSILFSHHYSNRTFDTAKQLTQKSTSWALSHGEEFKKLALSTPFVQQIIPAMRNYFETENYIFVHGWIPCCRDGKPPHYIRGRVYKYFEDWRNSSEKDWEQARWLNGMLLYHDYDIKETGKTIVCGHWHTSFAHSKYSGICSSEFDKDAIFKPYISNSEKGNIIAIDGCVAHTHKVNCVVIED